MQSVKVVITGPFNAGKTTLIKAVSEITVLSTERQVSDVSGEGDGETTVAMDFGRITVSDDVVLYLFGTPGPGALLVHVGDALRGHARFRAAGRRDRAPQSFDDAEAMIEFFTSMSDVPFVVAANKVVPDDGDVQTSAEGPEPSRGVPLFPVDARARESVKAVLLGLLYEILKSMG